MGTQKPTSSGLAPDLIGEASEHAALAETGRRLMRGPADFVKGAVSLETLPPADRLEITFAGRSNVGKSSLINALTGRKGLARTSNTPGRTQELNYFTLGEAAGQPFYMVDLPGYGYAKIERKKVERWTRLVKDYLRGRPNLRRVFLLIDSRHGIKENDREIMRMLDQSAVSYQIVLTKFDKLAGPKRQAVVDSVRAVAVKHVACHPRIISTSSDKGWGMDHLSAEIADLVRS